MGKLCIRIFGTFVITYVIAKKLRKYEASCKWWSLNICSCKSFWSQLQKDYVPWNHIYHRQSFSQSNDKLYCDTSVYLGLENRCRKYHNGFFPISLPPLKVDKNDRSFSLQFQTWIYTQGTEKVVLCRNEFYDKSYV